MLDWKKLLRAAYDRAKESTDLSTQNGAVLVNEAGDILAAAANVFPRGIKETPERLARPTKYAFVVHAEKNAIYLAAKNGVKTDNLTMVCCWATCADCAQAIIQSGIKRLVTHKQALDKSHGDWSKTIDVGLGMLREAGVEIIVYGGEIGAGKILHDGVHWEP